MPRTIELTPAKAIRISGLTASGQRFIRIQQMYRKKGQEEWQFGYQGISLPLDDAEGLDGIKKALKFYISSDKAKFPVIDKPTKDKAVPKSKRKSK